MPAVSANGLAQMFIVGLTGGIGSGKSAAARCFEELGIKVVDADQASRKVVEPGMPALEAVAEHFGSDILLPDGTLDRATLRERIFRDDTEKTWLEGLLHPLIKQWIRKELTSAKSPYAILESPLLLEIGQSRGVNRVLVVDVPEPIQVERAMGRDANTEEQIRAIMASQMSREKRLAGADDVIDNSGGLEDLRAQVEDLHRQYLDMAEAANGAAGR